MEDGIFFNQSKYIKEMLKKFGLEDSKPTKTPMSTEIKLTKDDEADSVDSSKYRGETHLGKKCRKPWLFPFHPAITAMNNPYHKKGEKDIWSMRMREYIFHTYHNLRAVYYQWRSSEDLPAHWRTSAPPRSEDCHTTAAKRIKKGL
ncbi:hypothetical protein Tco_0017297 [Tanacetum coccineum]|uniref:Reverse transcriptase Ty1/copia-type domain-containing protein n=1 Tax=Tanacetum coccineum TaxID=301880 RepID=A0ABQ5FI07_9ASTR